MKRPHFLLISLTILALGGSGPVFAWEGSFFNLFQIPFSPREAAMGGVHAAQADDISTLVSNPAGFRSAGPDLSVGTITVSIYDSAPSQIDRIVTGLPDIGPGIQRSTFNLLGPLFFGYVGNGLGFGIFTDSNIRTWTWGGYPAGRALITENLVLIAGYAFRIPLPEESRSTLDVGFSVPFFVAAQSNSSQDIRGLFTSSLSPMDVVMDQPFTFSAGVSIELGALYTWNNEFSVGIAARDFAITTWETYSTLDTYLKGGSADTSNITPIPMDISIGIRWSPPAKMLVRSIDGLTLMADYNDIFDFLFYPPAARHPLLHIGLGMEITLLKAVKLRAGFYQLLPSGGISLDLAFLTLDMAVFGRELSTQPWGTPVYGYMAGIRFHV
jgi:hypothetical protein